MNELKQQLKDYCSTMSDYTDENRSSIMENETFIRVRDKIYNEMDKFILNNPSASAVALKSELHCKIADYFEPVIFDELPFYYEMGIRPSENWGATHMGLPSSWGLTEEIDNVQNIDPDISSINVKDNALCFATGKIYDTDHHCLGYSTLFKIGINGIISNIEAEKDTCDTNSEKYDFLCAAEKAVML